MLHVGIDFSISSPCVCFWNSGQEHLFENCEFFFLHSRNLIEKISFPSNISFAFSSPATNNTIRFSTNAGLLAAEIQKRLDKFRKYVIILEGYSMGAKGRTFDIGEATGIFKYYLSQYKLYPKIVAPTAVKKLSVGKGNANKWQMFDRFIEINNSLANENWIQSLKTEKHLQPPLPDLVDSFFIANSFSVIYDQG